MISLDDMVMFCYKNLLFCHDFDKQCEWFNPNVLKCLRKYENILYFHHLWASRFFKLLISFLVETRNQLSNIVKAIQALACMVSILFLNIKASTAKGVKFVIFSQKTLYLSCFLLVYSIAVRYDYMCN